MNDLYESIPQQVQAIQWDGSHQTANHLYVETGGRTKANQIGGELRLLLLAGTDGAQEWVPVPVGHWVVHPPGDTSDVWPVDHGYFAAKYRPVP